MNEDRDEEEITAGIVFIFSGKEENVDMAISNLIEDANIQEKMNKVELQIEDFA